MGDDLNESLALLLEIYDTEFPLLLAQLQEGVTRGDVDAVRRVAHTVKSSCGALGAAALGAVCQRMEGMARSSDLAGVQVLLPEFDRLMLASRQALASCQF